jgi:hypothetical protein
MEEINKIHQQRIVDKLKEDILDSLKPYMYEKNNKEVRDKLNKETKEKLIKCCESVEEIYGHKVESKAYCPYDRLGFFKKILYNIIVFIKLRKYFYKDDLKNIVCVESNVCLNNNTDFIDYPIDILPTKQ